MAAPTTSTRVTPVGTALENGYSSKITFATDTDISFWEKTVQPPGVEGGEPIETTTMYNTTWRSYAAQALKTLTPLTCTVAYDPVVYDQIIALINVNGAITCLFPNNDTLDFYGFLQNFEPAELAEGTHPEATITITPTNVDPSDGSIAAANVNYKTAAGTD